MLCSGLLNTFHIYAYLSAVRSEAPIRGAGRTRWRTHRRTVTSSASCAQVVPPLVAPTDSRTPPEVSMLRVVLGTGRRTLALRKLAPVGRWGCIWGRGQSRRRLYPACCSPVNNHQCSHSRKATFQTAIATHNLTKLYTTRIDIITT